MKRLLPRLATMLVAVPLAAGLGTATANAGTVTVPGCYGGGAPAAVVCNLTVSYGVPYDVEKYTTTVPVCVGTCQDVPVTLVRLAPGDPLQVCVTWTNGLGQAQGDCVTGDEAVALADTVRAVTADALEASVDFVCESVELASCTVLRNVTRAVAEVIRP